MHILTIYRYNILENGTKVHKINLVLRCDSQGIPIPTQYTHYFHKYYGVA